MYEATLMITVGTNTVITALCATVFYLARNPQVIDRLTSEIRQTFFLSEERAWDDRVPSTGDAHLRAGGGVAWGFTVHAIWSGEGELYWEAPRLSRDVVHHCEDFVAV